MRDLDIKTLTASKKYVVSTVHLLLPHRGGDYETMVFHAGLAGEIEDYLDLACHRYETADLARAGHERVVAEWNDK